MNYSFAYAVYKDTIMMECFLRAMTSDFGSIASATGFKFNQYSGSVDWENLGNTIIKRTIN